MPRLVAKSGEVKTVVDVVRCLLTGVTDPFITYSRSSNQLD